MPDIDFDTSRDDELKHPVLPPGQRPWPAEALINPVPDFHGTFYGFPPPSQEVYSHNNILTDSNFDASTRDELRYSHAYLPQHPSLISENKSTNTDRDKRNLKHQGNAQICLGLQKLAPQELLGLILADQRIECLNEMSTRNCTKRNP
jgi:hypothetical protein